jgi:hypothetical protein
VNWAILFENWFPFPISICKIVNKLVYELGGYYLEDFLHFTISKFKTHFKIPFCTCCSLCFGALRENVTRNIVYNLFFTLFLFSFRVGGGLWGMVYAREHEAQGVKDKEE